MGKVYSQAFNVLIWLGSEDDNTVQVLDHLWELKRAKDTVEKFNLTLARRLALDLMSRTDIPAYDNRIWKALNDFLRRPFFT